jgi:sterol desaturase/sphingolipid hydroxylase (fatty acid hydroxylase superfamily)
MTMDLDLTIYAIPAFIFLMVVESVLTSRARLRGYEARDTATSLTMGVGNVLIDLFMKSVHFVLLGAVATFALFDIAGNWWEWILLLIGTDFCYYWFHRLSHEVRFLWSAHVNHHSSRHYNLSTALRQSWTTPFTSLLFYWPLALLGFDPAAILASSAINTIYQFWIHTEVIDRTGPLEWVINTPSHHRVHHGRNVEYLDRNYGGILIVFDRLFGSFEPERAPVDYGLTKNLDSFNPIVVAFHDWQAMIRQFRSAASWREALGYVFQPPGWSPNGESLTARQMRAASERELAVTVAAN